MKPRYEIFIFQNTFSDCFRKLKQLEKLAAWPESGYREANGLKMGLRIHNQINARKCVEVFRDQINSDTRITVVRNRVRTYKNKCYRGSSPVKYSIFYSGSIPSKGKYTRLSVS